jgi:membrane-associated phospholipid phosphatase
MRFLTDFADQAVILPVVLMIAVMLLVQGWRRGALAWLGVIFTTFGLMLVLKLVFLACVPLADPIDIHSPSGHVAAATVVAGGLVALLTRRRASVMPVAVLIAVVIGVSRLVLGMHSLPEVLLGAVVGLAGTVALVRLAGTPPPLQPGRVLAVVVIIAALFHGMHLPAEAAIRHSAARALLEAVCQPGAHADASDLGAAASQRSGLLQQ